MNKLYVLKNDDNIKIVFSEVNIVEETDTEYIVDTFLGDVLKGVDCNFPKDKINVRLPKGFVTDDIRNKKLIKELENIYNYIDETHKDYIEHHTSYKEINDEAYSFYLKKIEELKKERRKRK